MRVAVALLLGAVLAVARTLAAESEQCAGPARECAQGTQDRLEAAAATTGEDAAAKKTHRKKAVHDHGHAHTQAHSHAHAHNSNHGHAHNHQAHEHAHGKPNAAGEPRDAADVWKEALLATLAVTLLGNASILFFLWISVSESALKAMVGFAAGGLLGDVFLHLLPHAHELSTDAHDGAGLWVLAGVVSFFAAEKAVRVGAFRATQKPTTSPATLRRPAKKRREASASPKPPGKKQAPAHSHEHVFGVKPGAFLNLVADTAHNFVDGMALAASFQTSHALGLSIAVAVGMHEVPHELGDFAVLVSQGFTKKQAFLAQFISALGALCGCVFGLLVSSERSAAMLNFTAGAFIYVALCDILPDLLLHDAHTYAQACKELAAIALGVYLMHLIGTMEQHA